VINSLSPEEVKSTYDPTLITTIAVTNQPTSLNESDDEPFNKSDVSEASDPTARCHQVDGENQSNSFVPEITPQEAAFIKEHFNDQLSDEEDNSWADELTEHAADDYYGEEGEEGEYGTEGSPFP
jgi:hypothetical protein